MRLCPSVTASVARRLTLAAAVSYAGYAAAGVLYEETFPFDPAVKSTTDGRDGNARLIDAGWDTSAGHDLSQLGIGLDETSIADSGDGAAADQDGRFGCFSNRDEGNTTAVFTDEQPIPTDAPVKFVWHQRGDFHGDNIAAHIAVRVDGVWFASASAAETTRNYEPAWQVHELVYDPAAVNWVTLDLSTRNPVTTTAPASDLNGDIEAFGFFIVFGDKGTLHIDRLQIVSETE